MDPDHFGNRETGYCDWKEWLQGDNEDILLDGANAMPSPFLFQSQVNDMGGTSNRVLQTDNPRDRKKRNDKEYRARCREDQKRQQEELEKLAVENARMKDENESLVKERVTVLSPKLESAAIEINQLRSESQSLKRNSDNQRILVHALTEKLDSQNKLRSLHDEVARLRQNVPQDPRMQEKKKLMEELLRLENENRLQELQNQAYCMMIQNDGDPRGDEADQALPAGLL
ncbi:hypothetical protein POPTR_003G101700v4 [Populus trichocarpa]|uniref:Uncharacterized protein n=3 Tax=Populus TaxID=3689 RepID=A0A3N7ENG6_POPTR|nr:uncharacterized protein LOC7491899 isoform X2 [Populus trichocarpa]ABK96357.1 unknown [Populus trichocarpa x Populus deltoides]KAI5594717.1 hypothetical protein BDE02_03G090500 [Populus trichocarpa]RQO88142.1 hypothetical protein POPTR_003G101700v4 [Populus trichocarpa]|eukprot:XP_024452382.1 E3 ubiquitin-protein ligase LRSAM1 isoform X1 [Populus trichocarpa]